MSSCRSAAVTAARVVTPGSKKTATLAYAWADPPPEVVPWLYAVTRNLARTAGRGERRRRVHEAIAAGRTPTWFVPTVGAGVDAAAATAALNGLSPDDREVIVARVWGGLN